LNYFAHGYRFIDDPAFLAGTAVPDWLCVVDRQVRVRAKHAALCVDDADPFLASFARGIMQHHRDDERFHGSLAFHELCGELTKSVRRVADHDGGHRASFLGHLLVELLLDAELIGDYPHRLVAYYAALDQVDPQAVQAAVNRIASRPTDRLADFLPLFCRERFLSDYADDDKLMRRINQVLRRVGLPTLPSTFRDVLPEARSAVAARRHELIEVLFRTAQDAEGRK
jgi:hypothetical protein